MKIGTYPTLGLAEARRLARERLVDVAGKIDPAADGDRKRDAFEHVAAEFIQRYAKSEQPRSWKETERILNRYITPVWKTRLIVDISRRDVIEILDGIVDRGAPVMAKQTHAVIRKLFYWAVARGIIEASPCVQIPAPAHAQERDRILSDDELCAVWRACEPLQWPFGPLVKLLILTAQRRDEVATMEWSDIDLDAALWTIPRGKTKSDRTHEVPLALAAREVIKRLPKTDDRLVFTTTKKGVPVAGFSNAKRRLDGLSDVADWHLHDLRRTAASGMARLGVMPHIVEKILNHQNGTISGVAAIYNRYDYAKEKRAALDKWAAVVQQNDARRPINQSP